MDCGQWQKKGCMDVRHVLKKTENFKLNNNIISVITIIIIESNNPIEGIEHRKKFDFIF
jgi:hypothetical protein